MTVLFVEDDPDILEILAKQFAVMEGVTEVVTASSASEALDAFDQSQPHLIVTDYGLGAGMNGVELTLEFKKINPDVVVFMFCGNDRARASALAAGVSKFFLKGGNDRLLLLEEMQAFVKK